MPRLRILDHTGDTTLEWTRDDQASQQEVNREFDRIVASGALAYTVDAPGKGSQITKFDPGAEEIIVTGPVAGG